MVGQMSLEDTPRTYCAQYDVKVEGACTDSDFKRVVDATFAETLERELTAVRQELDRIRDAFQIPSCVTYPQFIADMWRDQHSRAMVRLGEVERELKALTNENDALRDAINALHDAVDGKRFDDDLVAELLNGAMRIPCCNAGGQGRPFGKRSFRDGKDEKDARDGRPEGVCRWTVDEEGTWFSACGEAHVFETGGPQENKHGYCPYCGREVVLAGEVMGSVEKEIGA